MNRRSLLRGLFAAPAIVAASSLMPVRVMAALAPLPPKLWGGGTIFMPQGTYLISAPLVFSDHDGGGWRDTHLIANASPALRLENVRNMSFTGVRVTTLPHGLTEGSVIVIR